jgi:ABC-2 type transport system permease protein
MGQIGLERLDDFRILTPSLEDVYLQLGGGPALLDAQMAAAPYRPRRRTLPVMLSHYGGLLRLLLAEYRNTWFIHVIFGFLMPLGIVFFVKYMGGGISQERTVYLLGGNLATAIVFGPTMMLAGKIGWGRQNREFDYWASLPLPKMVLILAIVSVSLVFALPGLAALYLLGRLMLGLPLGNGLWLIPLVPLGALSLVGLGAFIGCYARDGQTANTLANLLMLFATFLSPTMIPVEAMPAPLRLVAPLTPITYAADAFRLVLNGKFGTGLAYDVLILLGFTSAFLWLVHRKLDWRAA